MSIKSTIHLFVTAAVLIASFATGPAAMAWSGCGSSYTVQSGDSLGTIANRCGTSVSALRLANPSLGYWIYAGQILWMPGAFVDNGNGYAVYTVARGDTLKSIANRFGTTMSVLGSLNGLSNFNLIYEGQRLTVPNGSGAPAPNPYPQPVPATGGTYTVQWGDTMRKIAARMNVNMNDLIAANPQIANPNVIYFGQVVYLPASPSNYTVKRGDTMKIIAARYDTTVDYLLGLNPQIWNANWIYTGQVIRVR